MPTPLQFSTEDFSCLPKINSGFGSLTGRQASPCFTQEDNKRKTRNCLLDSSEGALHQREAGLINDSLTPCTSYLH